MGPLVASWSSDSSERVCVGGRLEPTVAFRKAWKYLCPQEYVYKNGKQEYDTVGCVPIVPSPEWRCSLRGGWRKGCWPILASEQSWGWLAVTSRWSMKIVPVELCRNEVGFRSVFFYECSFTSVWRTKPRKAAVQWQFYASLGVPLRSSGRGCYRKVSVVNVLKENVVVYLVARIKGFIHFIENLW